MEEAIHNSCVAPARHNAEHLSSNWGEPERAPPSALQRLRSVISYVLPNAHARSLRGQHFQVQRSVEAESAGQRRGQAESHRGSARGIVALLNRIEHGMLYTHSRNASYRIDGYSQLRQRQPQLAAKL